MRMLPSSEQENRKRAERSAPTAITLEVCPAKERSGSAHFAFTSYYRIAGLPPAATKFVSAVTHSEFTCLSACKKDL